MNQQTKIPRKELQDRACRMQEQCTPLAQGNFLVLLLLLSMVTLACRLSADTSGTVTPSPHPGSESSTVPQPRSRPAATPQPQPSPPPTPTTELTPTLTPTQEPAPTQLVFRGAVVSHNGVSFTVDPALGQVFVRTEPDSLSYIEFAFAPEGTCRDVGCVTVYPVVSYRKEIPFGADIIDGLGSAIQTQSKSYFPALMAHILLRSQTRHLGFQNGAGIRALVIKGQNTVWANNESIVYEFHGLTGDGRYYVSATFPIDAPILLSTYDPAENVNEGAIPVPELPAAPRDVQQDAVMRGYNQEAQRQLDLLDASRFTPDLGPLDALIGSLQVEPPAEISPGVAEGVGVLQLYIDYRGNWYRETFSYTKEAENITHFVLVMPASQVDRATADQIFSSIDFSTVRSVLSFREDRKELDWALEYLYQAPGAYFRGQFEPGTYYVAVAFVAAPLSQEEAGVPDDTILYPGITGGGASTDYEKIEIGTGENTVTVSLTDKDGWACPWLYTYQGRSFERMTEILRNVRGKQNEQTETTPIGAVEVVDSMVTLKVAEEKNELTFIDELYVIIDGIEVRAEADSAAARIAEKDQDYLLLAGGESREFRFRVPASLAGMQRVAVSVVVSGFYVPLEDKLRR